MQEIAERAGVSKAMVSRALRGVSYVAEAKRERICRIAKELGYEPKPVVSRLAARHWGSLGRSTDSTLHLLDWCGSGQSSATMAQTIRHGITQGAKELGYRLELVDLAERGTLNGLDRQLTTRGARGLLIGRMDEAAPKLDLSWDQYTVVKAHVPLVDLPPFAMVRRDPADALLFALGKVASLGYRRIGVVLLEHSMPFVEDVLRDGVLEAMKPTLAKHAIEMETVLLKYPENSSKAFPRDTARLGEWMKAWKPDVVIGFNHYIHSLLSDGCGFRLPLDCAYCSLHVGATEEGGLLSPYFTEGVGSVHLLDMLLRMNQKGIPSQPIIQQPPHVWKDSPLLPKRRRPRRAVREMFVQSFPQLRWHGHPP